MGSYSELNDDAKKFLRDLQLNFKVGNTIVDFMDLLPLAQQGIIKFYSFKELVLIYSKLYCESTRFVCNLDKKLMTCTKAPTNEVPIIWLDNLLSGCLTEKEAYYHKNDVEIESTKISKIYDLLLHFTEDDRDLYTSLKLIKIRHDMSSRKLIYMSRLLTSHQKVCKLCVSIILDTIGNISAELSHISPVNNNFMAYKLALDRGDNNIICLILKHIVHLYLLYNEVLLKQTRSQSLTKDIYKIIHTFF